MKDFLLQKRQFLLYCLIGGCGTMLSTIVFTCLMMKFGQEHYQIANAVAYAAGTLVSFILNSRYNFRVSDRTVLRFVSFFSVALLGWAVSAGVLRLLIGRFGMNEYAAYFTTLIVVMLLQYNLNRLVSFRKS